jgi:hypothetical protein
MNTETRTDGRPAGQADTQTRSAEQMRMEQYDPRMANQRMNNPQIQEIRPTGNETKGSFLTTEFWIYLAAVAAVLIASYAVGDTATHGDYFRADKAWWFISLLTIGYLGSRGLAKAGSPTRSKAKDDRQR